MSPETQEASLDLKAFIELLRRLDEHGIPFAVIGGMAVSAYARLRGKTIFSADLDIVTTEATLQELIETAPARALLDRMEKRGAALGLRGILTRRGLLDDATET